MWFQEFRFPLTVIVIYCLCLGCTSKQKEFKNPQGNDSQFEHSEISMFTISAIMHQKPGIMETAKFDGYYRVSYVRPSDNKQFQYKVKVVEPNKVIWSTINGRWRDSPQDEQTTYSIDGETLIINQKYSDGSISKKEFSK